MVVAILLPKATSMATKQKPRLLPLVDALFSLMRMNRGNLIVAIGVLES